MTRKIGSHFAYIRDTDKKVFHVEHLCHVTQIRSADGTEEDAVKCFDTDRYVSMTEGHSYTRVRMQCPHEVDTLGGECKGPLAPEGETCCDDCSDEFFRMVKSNEVLDFIP